MIGHSNYQIGPNWCKLDQIGDTHYHIWTLCPQLHYCKSKKLLPVRTGLVGSKVYYQSGNV